MQNEGSDSNSIDCAARRVRVLQKIPLLEKSNGIEERGGEDNHPRWPRTRDKNRIGISISFQYEIKGRLNADTLRPIEWISRRGKLRREGGAAYVEDRNVEGNERGRREGREKGDWRRIGRWQRGIRCGELLSIVFFLSISPSPRLLPSLFILLAGFCTERRAIYRDMSRYSWRSRYKVSPSICVGVQLRSQVLYEGWGIKSSLAFFVNILIR